MWRLTYTAGPSALAGRPHQEEATEVRVPHQEGATEVRVVSRERRRHNPSARVANRVQ